MNRGRRYVYRWDLCRTATLMHCLTYLKTPFGLMGMSEWIDCIFIFNGKCKRVSYMWLVKPEWKINSRYPKCILLIYLYNYYFYHEWCRTSRTPILVWCFKFLIMKLPNSDVKSMRDLTNVNLFPWNGSLSSLISNLDLSKDIILLFKCQSLCEVFRKNNSNQSVFKAIYTTEMGFLSLRRRCIDLILICRGHG